MNSYIDSSFVLAILFQEEGCQEASLSLSRSNKIYSSTLLEAEVLAAIKRNKLNPDDANEIFNMVSFVNISRRLTPEILLSLQQGYAKGADTHHLATALYLDPTAEKLAFLTLDKVQMKIAAQLGFKIL